MGRNKQPEAIIVSQVRALLKMMQVQDFKHVAAQIGEAGISDIIAALPPTGRAVFIEIKTPTGYLSPPQRRFLDRMRSAGAIAFVARSARDVSKELAKHGFQPAIDIEAQFPKPAATAVPEPQTAKRPEPGVAPQEPASPTIHSNQDPSEPAVGRSGRYGSPRAHPPAEADQENTNTPGEPK